MVIYGKTKQSHKDYMRQYRIDNPDFTARERLTQKEYRQKPQTKETHRKYIQSWRQRRKDYIIRMRRNRKRKFALLLGNQCKHCGRKVDTSNLCLFDFHHTHPSYKEKEKEFLNSSITHFTEKIKSGKVILLCALCHRLLHAACKDGQMRLDNAIL